MEQINTKLCKRKHKILKLIAKGKICTFVEYSNEQCGVDCKFGIIKESIDKDKYLSKQFKKNSYGFDEIDEALKFLYNNDLIKPFEHDDFLIVTENGRAFLDEKKFSSQRYWITTGIAIGAFALSIAAFVISLACNANS